MSCPPFVQNGEKRLCGFDNRLKFRDYTNIGASKRQKFSRWQADKLWKGATEL